MRIRKYCIAPARRPVARDAAPAVPTRQLTCLLVNQFPSGTTKSHTSPKRITVNAFLEQEKALGLSRAAHQPPRPRVRPPPRTAASPARRHELGSRSCCRAGAPAIARRVWPAVAFGYSSPECREGPGPTDSHSSTGVHALRGRHARALHVNGLSPTAERSATPRPLHS